MTRLLLAALSFASVAAGTALERAGLWLQVGEDIVPVLVVETVPEQWADVISLWKEDA